MRTSIAQPRLPQHQCIPLAAAQAAVTGPAPYFLSIPRTMGVIPKKKVLHQETSVAEAKLALNLLDMGLIGDAENDLSGKDLVAKGLQRWINRMVEPHALIPTVDGAVSQTLESAVFYGQEEDGVEKDEFYLVLAAPGAGSSLSVGSVLMQLESILPGLGETVMRNIEMASVMTWPAFTPGRARYEGSYLYWQGNETQSDWEEDMESESGADWKEEVDVDELFTPDDFHDSFKVPWILAPKKRIPERKLKKLARRHPLRWVRDLCRLCVHMSALIDEEVKLPGVEVLEVQGALSSVVIRWDEDDAVDRVHDDFINSANECCDSYTDAAFVFEIPIQKEAFVLWEQSLRKGFHLFHLFGRALDVIAEQNQEIQHDRNPSDQ